MQIIGLLGGVASGKSTVAREFVRRGAGLLDADRIGHEVLRLPQVEAAAEERWGSDIFAADGRIDRTRLAQIVFGPNDKAKRERKYLEQITHPEIVARLRQQTESLAAAGVEVVVCDAALLLEAGLSGFCDTLIFVECPRETRLVRALARGWSCEEFAARENAQELLEVKRGCADAMIDNSGPTERTQAQVEQFWASLLR
jgi:dephospho-CoA kinase